MVQRQLKWKPKLLVFAAVLFMRGVSNALHPKTNRSYSHSYCTLLEQIDHKPTVAC